jgi:FlaG/FlaF family flagellin (archaellin)
MNTEKKDMGVSPAFGSIILVTTTVIMSTVVGSMILGMTDNSNSFSVPSITVDERYDGTKIVTLVEKGTSSKVLIDSTKGYNSLIQPGESVEIIDKAKVYATDSSGNQKYIDSIVANADVRDSYKEIPPLEISPSSSTPSSVTRYTISYNTYKGKSKNSVGNSFDQLDVIHKEDSIIVSNVQVDKVYVDKDGDWSAEEQLDISDVSRSKHEFSVEISSFYAPDNNDVIFIKYSNVKNAPSAGNYSVDVQYATSTTINTNVRISDS